ncbi:MAG: DedA family protein, partial [Abditibacteriota bacterium]|nr:DedA family protein [Abditibacteriota bacterium]
MEAIIQALTGFIINVLDPLGYWGIIILMGIESACIPVPSEIIMPYGGYLAATYDNFNVICIGLAGAIGNVWGSALAYWAGRKGGRRFVIKYGKYILMNKRSLDRADRFFERFGDFAVFIGRVLPIIRTFISFPAGVSRVPFGKFVLFTFLGSVPWCMGLAWIGWVLTAKFPDTPAWEYV